MILIDGMTVPTDREILLRIDEKGEVYVYNSYPTELHKAVTLPPHGRLVDADELLRSLEEIVGRDPYWMIHDAPTVVEAEGEA